MKEKYIIGIDEVVRAASKRRASPKYIIGIDEVGRGALAGPVVVAAVCFPTGLRISNRKLGALKDSKKLSPKLRELWLEYFKSIPEISYKTARVYPRAIERINISQAANRAAGAAVKRLIKSLPQNGISRNSKPRRAPQQHTNKLEFVGMFRIFLDGGLYLGNKSKNTRIASRNNAKNFRKDSRFVSRYLASTIVRGDEKITAVKVASIIAKVQRDKYMEKLSQKHPRYGFEIHRGYGTKRHLKAIRRHGPSDAHRLTFIGKYHRMANSK